MVKEENKYRVEAFRKRLENLQFQKAVLSESSTSMFVGGKQELIFESERESA